MRLFRSKEQPFDGSSQRSDSPHCSFCGKEQNEVKKLIPGPSVFICNECVDICNEIIANDAYHQTVAEHPGPFVSAEEGAEVSRWCSLCHMPATGFLDLPEKGQICADCMAVIRAATGDVEREPKP